MKPRSRPAPSVRAGLFLAWVCLGLIFPFLLPSSLRAQVAGSLDTGFNPNVGANFVSAIAVQPDGKIVIGGQFSTVGAVSRMNIERLLADGTPESATFNPGTGADFLLNGAAVQTDGKVLIAGDLNSVNGQSRSKFARLNTDGSVEPTSTFTLGAGADGTVYSTMVQPDGKILLSGFFSHVAGLTRWWIARLNTNGTVDATFTTPGTGADNGIYTLGLQPDGKILIGGPFTSINGSTRNRLARLNSDGTVEATNTFNPQPNSHVYCLAVQADGKILIGGEFTTIGGVARSRIARLNTDGTLDTSFTPGAGADGGVYEIAVQADGKILMGGGFTSVGGVAHSNVARLGTNGVVESTATFSAGANGGLRSLALQADGRILLGGVFTTVNSVTRNRMARLTNDLATQTLTVPTPSLAQWMRSGTTPEIAYATFEVSTNGGTNYTSLGLGSRIAGGWQCTNLNVSGNGQIRARGRTTGGYYNGSSGLVESITSFSFFPEIAVQQPAGTNLTDGATTNNFGNGVVGANSAPRTFIVTNVGNLNLNLGAFVIDGTNAADFSVSVPGTNAVAPASNTTFTVTFNPGAPGNRAASLHLTNDDSDENPFDIALTGFGMSTNAAITNLVLNGAPLTPGFSPTNFSYTAYVAYTSSNVVVTPTADDATATIKVNASSVASGSPSAPVSLNVGPNLITVVATAQDNVRSNVYALNVTRADPPGAPGPGFADTNYVVNSNPIGLFIRVAIEQPDGKILLAGDITSVNGQPRLFIARLNADGSVEGTNTFNLGTGPNAGIIGAALQPDGKILLAGQFTSINGQPRNRIARLNPNGTVESTNTFNPGTGANADVFSAMWQPDGKILLWGSFTNVNGQPRRYLARLNADGSVESTNTFNLGTGPNAGISGVAVQPDGQILLAGLFTNINGQARNHLARLNADGSLESTNTFNPGTGPNNASYNLVFQPDGKILISGTFSSVDGQTRNGLARLAANGTLESTNIFQNGTGFQGGEVRSLGLQTDGKILVGGYFASANGQPRNHLARLYANGAVENTATFDIGAGADDGIFSVLGVTVLANGGIMVTGDFISFNGQPHRHVVRLLNQPATSSVTNTSSARVEWLRGGTSPEVGRVTFDMSTNGGATWSSLGNGARIAGGWELTGLSLPGSQLIRARGHVSCSDINASFGIVEAISVAPSSGSVSNGNLSVGNTNGGSMALTVGSVSVGGTNYIELHDARNPLAAGAGAVQVDANTIRVPAASVTNELQITGGAGDDHFVLDSTTGCSIPPGGLNIDGGGQALNGGDTLTVIGSYSTVQYNANNIGAGTIASDCGAVKFAGLEPVDYTSASLLNLAINVDPSNQFSGTITTTLSAMSGATNTGKTTVGFSGGLELMNFNALTGTLTITGDSAEADTIILQNVGTNFAGHLVIAAQATDSVVFTNGNITLGAGKKFDVTSGSVTLGAVAATAGTTTFHGGNIAMNIGGTTPGSAANQYSRLTVNGAISLSNSPVLNLTGSYAPLAGNSFMLITNDGGDAITGTFAGLPEGATFVFNGTPMRITYVGGNGNDVALIANSAPTLAANNGAVAVNEGSSITNTGTFSDADGNATVTLTASIGSVTKNNAGTWIWNFNSTDGPDQSQTVTVSATDGFATNAANFTLTVNNVAPTATPQNVTTAEDTPTIIVLSATDPGADTITNWNLTVSPTNGTLSGAAPNLVYTPNTNFNGADSFKFTATDSDGATSSAATVSLTVTPVNDAPVLNSLANYTVNSGATISFNATATDVDSGDVLNFSLVNPPAGANITGGGAFSWRPRVAQAGSTNTVTVVVTDNGAPNLSGTNAFTVVVNPLAPVLLAPLGYAGGIFQVEVSGTTGPDYVTMTSTNLNDWSELMTNLAPVTPFLLNLPGSGGSESHFYRVRLQP